MCSYSKEEAKHPHFLPIQRRCCSTQGFFGQPHLNISPGSGEGSLSNRRAISSAIMCRPIWAHAFTDSAEMQGPNSISSAFSSKGRRARHVAHTSLRRSNAGRLCASARCPTDPNRAKHLPTTVCPTSLAPCLSPLGHRPLTEANNQL